MEDENGAIVWGVAFAVTFIILIVAKIVAYFRRSGENARYYKMEMRRAESENEYRFWRRELRCHYLCMLPFVNSRNVMRVYQRVYHRSKSAEKEKRRDRILNILAPSVVGMFICALCLCGASWAWFTASAGSGTADIRSAAFKISNVTITSAIDGTVVNVDYDEASGIYFAALPARGTYLLSLSKAADSTSRNGYCCITVFKDVETAGTPYYTDNIGESYAVRIETDRPITVTVAPIWGDVTQRMPGQATVANAGYITVGDIHAAVNLQETQPDPVTTTSVVAAETSGSTTAVQSSAPSQGESVTSAKQTTEVVTAATSSTTAVTTSSTTSSTQADVPGTTEPEIPESIEPQDSGEAIDD